MILPRGAPAIYRREIRSDLAEVNLLCADIRALLEPHVMAEARFAIELLARESLCNAIIHGNRQTADKRVSLEIRVGRTWVRLRVTDEGIGFDWQRKSSTPHDARATSGRGMALYALYAEHMRFNALGNQVTLWVSRMQAQRGDVDGGRDGFLHYST